MWARVCAFFGYRKADDSQATVERARDDNKQEDYPDNDSASTSADTGSCNTSVEVVGMRGDKRKVAAAEGGPRKKRRIEDIKTQAVTKLGKDSASTSAVTESCNISAEVVGKRGDKRKVAAAEGGPRKKKRLEDIEKTPTKQQEFEAKYKELDPIGEGGCGFVFAGHRRADNLPVAIKHIPKKNIWCTHVDDEGNMMSIELAVMLKLGAKLEGTSPHIALLDYYQLEEELVLVMERPMPADDFFKYIWAKRGYMKEEEAKIILGQLVDAALDLESKDIFHRDIKAENMLIVTGSNVPRVRLIDFGLSCFDESRPTHREYFGTAAPPEFYSGNGYTAGPTTVFQIGVVLFEALHEEMEQFNTPEFYARFQCLPEGISENCNDFLLMCLRRDPNNRPTLQQLRNHKWLR